MNRKKLFSILIGTILLTSIISTTIPVRSQDNTIVVDQDGKEDYKSIQDAIKNANTGDTIIVNSGNYYERPEIQKTSIT